MELNKEECEIIVKMMEVCYSEGIGPDDTIFINYIKEKYPELIYQSFIPNRII